MQAPGGLARGRGLCRDRVMKSLKLLSIVLLAGCLQAPDGAEKHPLIGRKVVYDKVEGADGRPDMQEWYADGTMLFVTDDWLFPIMRARSRGVWRLDGNTYCRSFDEEARSIDDVEKPVCYSIEVLENGTRIRFERIGGGLGRRTWTGTYRR